LVTAGAAVPYLTVLLVLNHLSDCSTFKPLLAFIHEYLLKSDIFPTRLILWEWQKLMDSPGASESEVSCASASIKDLWCGFAF
jgi:hypothetical protein